MAIVLEFLAGWWKEILVALIVGAAFGYVYHLKSTISDQEISLVHLKTENAVIKDNNAKLEDSIKANNEAIGKLAEGSAATQKAFSTLGTNVKSQVSGLNGKLAQVLADKKPTSCTDTIKYLLDAIPEYQK